MSVTINQIPCMQGTLDGNGPVAASTHIYYNTLVFWALATGLIDDDTGLGANAFAGISKQEVDNSNGAASALTCEFYREGIHKLAGTGFTQASVGLAVYAVDNFTVTTDGATAGAVRIGVCTSLVSATAIMVEIDPDGSKFVDITVPVTLHATLTTRNLFIAPGPMRVVGISFVPDLVQGGALTATAVKAVGTATPASATTPLHNAGGINCNATAHTAQPLTLSATVADLLLAPGDRIGLVFSAALTTGSGLITIRLRKM
jgi:hypothetical protein